MLSVEFVVDIVPTGVILWTMIPYSRSFGKMRKKTLTDFVMRYSLSTGASTSGVVAVAIVLVSALITSM